MSGPFRLKYVDSDNTDAATSIKFKLNHMFKNIESFKNEMLSPILEKYVWNHNYFSKALRPFTLKVNV